MVFAGLMRNYTPCGLIPKYQELLQNYLSVKQIHGWGGGNTLTVSVLKYNWQVYIVFTCQM